MKRFLATLVVTCAALAGGEALAATSNGTLTVQATVSDACSVADGVLTFGAVNPTTGVALPVVANIAVSCTLATPFSVGLDDGANATGGGRRLRRGVSGDYLTYSLYKDLLLTTRFGDTGASDRVGGLGLGITSTPVVVYGTIPSGQTAASGSYTDSVQITLYY